MTPSQRIVHEAIGTTTAVDANGRRLLVRRLTALDTLRLFKAAGPVLAQNEPWLSMAGLAFSVMEIDGVPVPPPASEAQIENVIERLGDAGLAAIAVILTEGSDNSDPRPHLGNSLGTLS
jgi:hypothetical protein